MVPEDVGGVVYGSGVEGQGRSGAGGAPPLRPRSEKGAGPKKGSRRREMKKYTGSREECVFFIMIDKYYVMMFEK